MKKWIKVKQFNRYKPNEKIEIDGLQSNVSGIAITPHLLGSSQKPGHKNNQWLIVHQDSGTFIYSAPISFQRAEKVIEKMSHLDWTVSGEQINHITNRNVYIHALQQAMAETKE